MANWERRHADTLSSAIHTHRSRNPAQEGTNQRLEQIRVVVAQSAKTISTTGNDVVRHRAQVCAICRPATLYVCDVPSGWSDNCAFLRANSREFEDV